MSSSPKSDKVTIFHRINKVKMKAGATAHDKRAGFIDPKAMKAAQAAIDDQEDSYSSEIEAVIMRVDSSWEDLKGEKDSKKQKKLKSELYNYANNVKDIAETFKYELMGHFGKSLRDFCEKLDVEKDEHKIIVQAHIDVMWIAFQQNIKDHGGPVAEELKAIVAKAIEQHSA